MSELRNIVREFFLKLNCTVNGENELIIENVPKDFEKMYGKNGPYVFVFDENSNGEYLTSSSHLFNIISEYLRNKAKVTLLKLDLGEISPEELQKHIHFNGYSPYKINKKSNNDYIYKLTFETTVHYLNETEKFINHLYIHDHALIENFNLEDYSTVPATRREIKHEGEIDMKLPQEKIKLLLQDRLIEIKDKLKISLDREILRINEHYDNLSKEAYKEIESTKIKLAELKNSPDDLQTKKAKEQKLQETILRLEEKIKPQELEKEKKFHLIEEKNKHSINVSSKLINQTIICFPIFSLQIVFMNNKKFKTVDVEFNALTKQINMLACECCSSEIKEIIICSSNHLLCRQCGDRCSCNAIQCIKCRRNNCYLCSKQICDSCTSLCSMCRKNICQADAKTDFITKKIICRQCGTSCQSCKRLGSKQLFKKIENKYYCPACFGKIKIQEVL